MSPYYACVALGRTVWSSAKVMIVPNCVDIDQLERPKLEGAVLYLGMIGIVPSSSGWILLGTNWPSCGGTTRGTSCS